MSAHQFPPTILREYDVRGVIGETLTADDARALGRAFGTRVVRNGGTRVSVGRDGRVSSPEMEAAVIEGLMACGLKVFRLGGCATPMLYYSVYALETDGGIMITGSHNPPNYNGFKMMLGTGPFFGADIQDLGRIAAEGDYESGEGSAEEADILDGYVDRLLRDVNMGRQLRIVWDCGNGAAGPSVNQVCMRLPSNHKVLFPEVDGTFPNHHPDPTVPENLEDLVAEVAERKADLGIAFDGDGDRIGVIDDKGRVLWGDQLLTVLAEDVLKDQPGATIIADVKASQVLFDKVAEFGGKPLMWRTGHSLIKTKMAETGAPLAGEMSGHIFFKDRYYGFDDALYAAIRLIEGLSHRDEPLSAIRDALPQVMNTPEMRFQCDDTRKFAVVDEVKAWLDGKDGIEVSDADGVRVNTPDGWWLLRASNTQDVLVARCESETEDGLERLKVQLREALTAVGETSPDI
ncbi:phosphomannomutase/phosphoglucomutase [Nisaea acidiphila]|uniref:Phosphomannomutase/phosphoglucomutase n=1 Tax=Nisaea acidiphila TaxID=1862145 RepID=A0A9J7APR1_9PROT|nr:phosphomannomutase/phosphoglucomutase [Nisaea acidiphila]UUX49150.1 phosphomannomutase/phosphoglucomutase [Nisaea acidiphila]